MRKSIKYYMALYVVGFMYVIDPTSLMSEEVGMKIISPQFNNNEFIPSQFTYDGKNVNPELIIENIPKETQSLALIVDDPDAPAGDWVHWVVYDIGVTDKIGENTIPGKQGINDFGKLNYGGPSPPSGTHRYFFKVYALDTKLGIEEGISKSGLEKAMEGHIIEETELIGRYTRNKHN
ncbi:MAG: YbhB/YbcL family Raf kinase inhibitor-like protein [Candidatus Omnitrophota bacterium]